MATNISSRKKQTYIKWLEDIKHKIKKKNEKPCFKPRMK